MVTSTGEGFLFGCLLQVCGIALFSVVFVYLEFTDVTTATPRPAMESCQPLPRLVFHPEGQICAIVISRLLDIIGIKLFFQKCAVLERGMCLDLNLIGL